MPITEENIVQQICNATNFESLKKIVKEPKKVLAWVRKNKENFEKLAADIQEPKLKTIVDILNRLADPKITKHKSTLQKPLEQLALQVKSLGEKSVGETLENAAKTQDPNFIAKENVIQKICDVTNFKELKEVANNPKEVLSWSKKYKETFQGLADKMSDSKFSTVKTIAKILNNIVDAKELKELQKELESLALQAIKLGKKSEGSILLQAAKQNPDYTEDVWDDDKILDKVSNALGCDTRGDFGSYRTDDIIKTICGRKGDLKALMKEVGLSKDDKISAGATIISSLLKGIENNDMLKMGTALGRIGGWLNTICEMEFMSATLRIIGEGISKSVLYSESDDDIEFKKYMSIALSSAGTAEKENIIGFAPTAVNDVTRNVLNALSECGVLDKSGIGNHMNELNSSLRLHVSKTIRGWINDKIVSDKLNPDELKLCRKLEKMLSKWK